MEREGGVHGMRGMAKSVKRSDIIFGDEGLRFGGIADYWGSLNVEHARQLALDILTKWPRPGDSELTGKSDATAEQWQALEEDCSEAKVGLERARAEITTLTGEVHRSLLRADRLARILSEALDIIAEPGRYVFDGMVQALRRVLTGEEEEPANLHESAIAAWRADAGSHVRSLDSVTRRLARRLIATIDELQEEEAKAKKAAEDWVRGSGSVDCDQLGSNPLFRDHPSEEAFDAANIRKISESDVDG